MEHTLQKDERQQALMMMLATQQGAILRRLYYRLKLYSGKEDISLSDFVETLQLPCIRCGNMILYRRGEKTGVPGVDRQLAREFANWKTNITQFSPDEITALQECGVNPASVRLSVIAR